MYRVEQWTMRGVIPFQVATKREANRMAELLRGDPNTQQTSVIKPNGAVRICRNTKAKLK